MHLFAKNHTDFEECCLDTKKIIDNCDLFYEKYDPTASTSESSNQNFDLNALADLINKMLRQDSKLTKLRKDNPKWRKEV